MVCLKFVPRSVCRIIHSPARIDDKAIEGQWYTLELRWIFTSGIATVDLYTLQIPLVIRPIGGKTTMLLNSIYDDTPKAEAHGKLVGSEFQCNKIEMTPPGLC